MSTIQLASAALMLVSFLFVGPSAKGQLYVELNNSSFEGEPRAGGIEHLGPIEGWFDCGRSKFPAESPPDIHPHRDAWKVTVLPQDGDTYLGMVVRQNSSYESVSQAIPSFMEEGKCYKVSVWLARSSTYYGLRSPGPHDTIFSRPFTTPAVFQILGGSNICSGGEILAESSPVDHDEWLEYEFVMTPSAQIRYITIRAFFDPDLTAHYNGHVLVDNLSTIREITCR